MNALYARTVSKIRESLKNLLACVGIYLAVLLIATAGGFLAERVLGAYWFNKESIFSFTTVLSFFLLLAWDKFRVIIGLSFVLTLIISLIEDYPIFWLYPLAFLATFVFVSLF